MTSLLSLPLEIQSQILWFLIPSSIQSIHAVLYTCKQLYNIALPLSVHTYRYTKASSEARSRSRILQFLHNFTITKPELASCVKAIILGNFSTHGEDKPVSLAPIGPTPEVKTLFQQQIRKRSHPGLRGQPPGG